MAESHPHNRPDAGATPDELIKDLEVTVSDEDQDKVVGGRKAGKGQQEFLNVKMTDVIITSVNPSGSGDSAAIDPIN